MHALLQRQECTHCARKMRTNRIPAIDSLLIIAIVIASWPQRAGKRIASISSACVGNEHELLGNKTAVANRVVIVCGGCHSTHRPSKTITKTGGEQIDFESVHTRSRIACAMYRFYMYIQNLRCLLTCDVSVFRITTLFMLWTEFPHKTCPFSRVCLLVQTSPI